jgi:hypothetical protein
MRGRHCSILYNNHLRHLYNVFYRVSTVTGTFHDGEALMRGMLIFPKCR